MKYEMSRGRSTIIIDTEAGTISGKTYEMRDVIKSDLYAKWDAANKVWRSDKLAETIEEYKEYLTRCYKLAKIEAVETVTAHKHIHTDGLCPICHTYCCGDCMANR